MEPHSALLQLIQGCIWHRTRRIVNDMLANDTKKTRPCVYLQILQRHRSYLVLPLGTIRRYYHTWCCWILLGVVPAPGCDDVLPSKRIQSVQRN